MNYLADYAPAKINLSLHVTGRRDDGYHCLETLVAFAGIDSSACDRLILKEAEECRIFIETDDPACNIGEEQDNLVFKAASSFARHFPLSRSGHFYLKKKIPVAAGLGGGSSDAASALRLLMRLNNISSDIPEIQHIAGTLGADVPMCLIPSMRFMSGIGDQCEKKLINCLLPAILINPRLPVSTPYIFQEIGLSRGEKRPQNRHPHLPDALEAHEPDIGHMQMTPSGGEGYKVRDSVISSDQNALLCDYLKHCRNDLQEAASSSVPVIREIITILELQRDCLFARMSGSGATVFGIFSSLKTAHHAADIIRKKHEEWWIAVTELG